MTKADFLQLLERALAQLPEEERQANLEYYSELLDDMLEEGMTEVEATAKLGSPSQIAQSILQEVPLGKLVSTRMKPKSGWTPLAIVLAVVGSPVWVPLLLLAAALVLSLFVSIWALGVAAVAVVVGLAVAVVAAPILAIRAAVLTLPLGLLLLGGGLVLLGEILKNQGELRVVKHLHVVLGGLGVLGQNLRDGLGGKAEVLGHLMHSVFFNTQSKHLV